MSPAVGGTARAPGSDVTTTLHEDGVATVEIHRPPNNFFDIVLIRDLADAYESLADGNQCRAIVLCAEGRHFCAGAEFTRRDETTVHTPFTIADLYSEGARLFRAPLPVVAAVHGAAVGGGLGLACSADFRVTCDEARFTANFARLGFHQGFALSVSLPAIVGQQRALDLLYTGRRLSGTEAHAIGLADRVVAAGDVRAVAHDLARDVAQSAPLAVRSIRATLRRDLLAALPDALAREAHEQDRLRETADFVEGVRSMSERRTPRFEGR